MSKHIRLINTIQATKSYVTEANAIKAVNEVVAKLFGQDDPDALVTVIMAPGPRNRFVPVLRLSTDQQWAAGILAHSGFFVV